MYSNLSLIEAATFGRPILSTWKSIFRKIAPNFVWEVQRVSNKEGRSGLGTFFPGPGVVASAGGQAPPDLLHSNWSGVQQPEIMFQNMSPCCANTTEIIEMLLAI